MEVQFADKVWPCIQSIARETLFALNMGYLFTAPTFSTVNGFRAIGITYDAGSGDYDFRYGLLPLVGPGSKVPMEYLAPEIDLFNSYILTGEDPPYYSESVAVAHWTTAYIHTIMTALDELTTASCELGEVVEVDVVPGLLKRRVQTVVASTAGRTYMLNFEGSIGPANSPPSMPFWGVDPSGWQAKINLAGGLTSRQAAAGVKALEDIGMSRIEVGMNNGDAIFNVVGGTRARVGP